MIARAAGLILALAAILIGSPTWSQPAPARIGWLTIGPHPFLDDFRQGRREPGYVEGLVVDLKTATALGLTLPPAFLARADEVLR